MYCFYWDYDNAFFVFNWKSVNSSNIKLYSMISCGLQFVSWFSLLEGLIFHQLPVFFFSSSLFFWIVECDFMPPRDDRAEQSQSMFKAPRISFLKLLRLIHENNWLPCLRLHAPNKKNCMHKMRNINWHEWVVFSPEPLL
jgi:hypothetical protein